MSDPDPKTCTHKYKVIHTEEQPYWDVRLSEVCYTEPSYWCPQCEQEIFSINGELITKLEKMAQDADLDSIPF